MKPLTIAFVTPEAVPFAKTGGLADVANSLPKALVAQGHHLSVFLPFYYEAAASGHDFSDCQKLLTVSFANKTLAFSLLHTRIDRVDFYLIKNDDFFNRPFLYGPPEGAYGDNHLRFTFFSKAVLTALLALDITPQIIHCNEWQAAAIPYYLRYESDSFLGLKDVKTVLCLHNIAYQGVFDKSLGPELGIFESSPSFGHFEFNNSINFLKCGIELADSLVTVSERYAEELMTPEFGYGLHEVIKGRSGVLSGILNGVDYTTWNPETDPFIKANYSCAQPALKKLCKKDCVDHFKIICDDDAPLLGIVSRLVDAKGFDIIVESIDAIIAAGCSLVILGFGDAYFNNLACSLSERYPDTVGVHIGIDNSLAHKIEAGCDIFCMPSRHEPCGLNQLYSLKYGTIPIVGEVGGLADTVIDCRANPALGTGFTCFPPNTDTFITALKDAVSVYKNKKAWHNLMKRAMQQDFSWQQSAALYERLYEKRIAT